MLIPDYKLLLFNLSDLYFGSYFKEAIEKHLKGNPIIRNERSITRKKLPGRPIHLNCS
jgi:hypothetical protein